MPTNEGPENTAPSITFSSRVAMSQLKRATSDEKVIRGAVFSGPEVMSACHITILTYYNNVNISAKKENNLGQIRDVKVVFLSNRNLWIGIEVVRKHF